MTGKSNNVMKFEIGRFTRHMWILAVLWTGLIGGLLAWNLAQSHQSLRKRALIEGRANFNKDQAFRLWASTHGGVYVPSNEQTPPNPYLDHIKDRDTETLSGKQLTLMNPAYMVRQMNELFGDLYGVNGHITSLKPLRPENAPDPWEKKALLAFETGLEEALEFTEINGKPYLRLMQPMVAKADCMRCHAHQGYKVGDVRGGVGVALPLAPLLVEQQKTDLVSILTLTPIWALGLCGLFVGGAHHQQTHSGTKSGRGRTGTTSCSS